jgi:hypothetical protein
MHSHDAHPQAAQQEEQPGLCSQLNSVNGDPPASQGNRTAGMQTLSQVTVQQDFFSVTVSMVG